MKTSICIIVLAAICFEAKARDRVQTNKRKLQNRSTWSIGIPRYVAGGIIGSTLGLGLGHSIQGRWWDGHGWCFTMGGLFTFFLLAEPKRDRVSLKFPWALFIGTKLTEAISVWTPPRRSVPFPKKITTSRYVSGGALGTIVGFGSGHLMQGRGIASALPYTLTQVIALSNAFVVCNDCKRTQMSSLILYAISKAIEIISLWGPAIRDYKIVSTTDQPSPSLTIVPLLHAKYPKLALRLTMTIGE